MSTEIKHHHVVAGLDEAFGDPPKPRRASVLEEAMADDDRRLLANALVMVNRDLYAVRRDQAVGQTGSRGERLVWLGSQRAR